MTSDHTRRMFADSVNANDNTEPFDLNGPTLDLIAQLNRMSEERHAWLSIAAAQIERWRAEEATQDNDPPEEAE